LKQEIDGEMIYHAVTLAKVVNELGGYDVVIIDPLSDKSEYKDQLEALASSINQGNNRCQGVIYTNLEDPTADVCADLSIILARQISKNLGTGANLKDICLQQVSKIDKDMYPHGHTVVESFTTEKKDAEQEHPSLSVPAVTNGRGGIPPQQLGQQQPLVAPTSAPLPLSELIGPNHFFTRRIEKFLSQVPEAKRGEVDLWVGKAYAKAKENGTPTYGTVVDIFKDASQEFNLTPYIPYPSSAKLSPQLPEIPPGSDLTNAELLGSDEVKPENDTENREQKYLDLLRNRHGVEIYDQVTQTTIVNKLKELNISSEDTSRIALVRAWLMTLGPEKLTTDKIEEVLNGLRSSDKNPTALISSLKETILKTYGEIDNTTVEKAATKLFCIYGIDKGALKLCSKASFEELKKHANEAGLKDIQWDDFQKPEADLKNEDTSRDADKITFEFELEKELDHNESKSLNFNI
jgi:hypothetical protein